MEMERKPNNSIVYLHTLDVSDWMFIIDMGLPNRHFTLFFSMSMNIPVRGGLDQWKSCVYLWTQMGKHHIAIQSSFLLVHLCLSLSIVYNLLANSTVCYFVNWNGKYNLFFTMQ